ncbi:MAG: 30S ribosomal protein S12 methylthiotransferase RimO [Zoogloeaceae bacterium]|jgi:ribosomal protein S12 methylthiotransferase|nr:30S ribosomal protein S12 methylthiotransferase RimO [Zoogloeaceae bacterium]
MNSPFRIGMVSLGCPKASSDAERILTALRMEGYLFTPSYKDAHLVIVNTCGFIEEAIRESLEAIGEALSENGKVIVTGCLGARRAFVMEAHPKVLAVTGPHAAEEVLAIVRQHLPSEATPLEHFVPPEGVRLTPGHFAYLKISEGCNHQCSFCVIPALRGPLVSRAADDVLTEAKHLVDAGVRELLLISQDTSAYGLDLKYRTAFWSGRPVRSRLKELCEALATLSDDLWIRLHYMYPYPAVDDLLPLMAQGKILPYLDVPFQHAAPGILSAMRRPAAAEDMLTRIARWRDICPELVIRSTFITGFPGETERDFQLLLDFLAEARLDRVGAFAYSPVEGATANALPDPIPEEEREERRCRLMEFQETISAEKLAARIGQEMTVLVDAVDEEGVMARSYGDAPEVDGLVCVNGFSDAEPGDFLEVRIIDADTHDLYAEAL